ncbi:MAG: MazG nucleotide pyrophosphohydrolase domain-containing protein [Vampirovibrionales bacterium]|nr:MazG nucleotide pyrophosphohydrolase domain-containing protein [Vampirovibrionales bacterium]
MHLPSTIKRNPDFEAAQAQLHRLLGVVAALRAPETGCPWDLAQTHQSLKPYLLEEAYETLAAIEILPQDLLAENNTPALATADLDKNRAWSDFADELGDVLLQVMLHAQLAQEAGHFDFAKIAQGLTDKLIRRHPHVFDAAAQGLATPEQVTQQWQQLKQQEQAQKNDAQKNNAHSGPALKSILSKVTLGQPALSHAYQVSKKAVGVGFTWPNFKSLWDCVQSEFAELAELLPPEALAGTMAEPELNAAIDALPNAAQVRLSLEDELGDLLFAAVNLARALKLHPEVALSRATQKFKARFKTMEELLAAEKLSAMPGTAAEPASKLSAEHMLPEAVFNTLDFEAWDALWVRAKQLQRSGQQ